MPEQKTDERGEYLHQPDTIEALMRDWEAEPLTKLGSNEPYKVGDGDGTKEEREATRKAFMAGEIDVPVVSYPRLDLAELTTGRERLIAIYARTQRLPDGIDKDLVRELMGRKIHEIYRHVLVAEAWATDDAQHRDWYLARAAETQIELFGRPDQRHFDAMLHTLRNRAGVEAGLAPDSETGRIAQELLDLLGERPAPEDPPQVGLSDLAREVLPRDMDNMYLNDDIMLPPPSEKPMSHNSARLWLNLIQEASGMQAAGWSTRLTDGTAIETTRSSRTVDIGRGRAEFTPDGLRSRNKHESRGHGLRAFNGDKLALKGKPMAAFALPDSLDFEEGLMVAMEQIATGKYNIPGRQYYTAAGLMLGMDRDGEQRNFRETFEIMWRRGVLEAADAGKKVDITAIKNTAYQTMMRMTRGGALDTRDLAYYNGYVKATDWLNTIAKLPVNERHSQWFYVMSAQFDPTNPLHAAYITR